METKSAIEVAMRLIGHVETFSERGLRPPHPVAQTFPAPYRVPETLAALWEWCGGERVDTPGLFTLAHPLLRGFPHADESSTANGLWRMWLEDPETIAWNLENAGTPGNDDVGRWGADWLRIAEDGVGGCLAVDAEGSVVIWRSDVDTEPELVHESFDRWMNEVADALDHGRVAIAKDDDGADVVTSGEWELSREGGDDWARRGGR